MISGIWWGVSRLAHQRGLNQLLSLHSLGCSEPRVRLLGHRRFTLWRPFKIQKNFTSELPRTTLGTGLARTGTNTGTPRELPKRLLRGRRGT